MRKETQDAFQEIVDTFSGADGGVKFACLKALIWDLDRRAANGDESAEKIIALTIHFSRLIGVADKILKERKPR